MKIETKVNKNFTIQLNEKELNTVFLALGCTGNNMYCGFDLDDDRIKVTKEEFCSIGLDIYRKLKQADENAN